MKGSRRAALLGMVALLSGTGLVQTTWDSGASAAVTAPENTNSAVTKSGSGPFLQLKVTVGQTQSLVNQTVAVSWSGGTPTSPSSGSFDMNYLQVMQCWGDNPNGPDRSQCEFGGLAAFDNRGGDFAATRQINYDTGLVDPLETSQSRSKDKVAFASVTGSTVSGNTNEFFDNSTTNEVPYARTQADGHGRINFEVQTDIQANGLGCGVAVKGANGYNAPRACWLVVVPRSNTEVDGSVVTGGSASRLRSSPLSLSNWQQRLVFPLNFTAVGARCPIGAKESRTIGLEAITDAFTSWQPRLCAGGGPIYGFSQVPESVSQRQLTGPDPMLGFRSISVPVDQEKSDQPLVYAPVSVSALTFAFIIDSRAALGAPSAIRNRDGQRVQSLVLTPRLVAKLLTQSYQAGVNSFATYVAKNPEDLTRDPDFLAMNPSFLDLNIPAIGDVLVPEGESSANQLIWSWVVSDADARRFLAGAPDPYGMTINPFYRNLTLPRDNFPKADPFCRTFDSAPPLCTLDEHAYLLDMHATARNASRGDKGARDLLDPLAIPPAYKSRPAQLTGQRAIIALTDTVSAARYGLQTASLRTAAGSIVVPTDASLSAAVAHMRLGSDGLLSANFTTSDRTAYPLPIMSYAVTSPQVLTKDQAADYASLIRFAAGDGQTPGPNPGQLPQGYLPMPAGLRQQADTVANLVAAGSGRRTSRTTTSPSTGGGSTTAPAPIVAPPASNRGSNESAQPTPVVAPTSAEPNTKTVASVTPGLSTGAGRYVILLALLIGSSLALALQGVPWWLAKRSKTSDV